MLTVSDRPDYLVDTTHLLVTGVTGSRTEYGGKTAMSNWLASNAGRAEFDVVLFLNVKHDDAPERQADVVAQSVQEAAHAMGDGATHICISPTDPDWTAVSRRLREFVDALPTDLRKMVVLDEAPELDEDALLWFVRVAGNGSNTKAVVISQSPGALSTSVRQQCIWVWVGPGLEDVRHVFRANNRGHHLDYILENHDPYQWTVITGPGEEDRDTFPPVPEEYAG